MKSNRNTLTPPPPTPQDGKGNNNGGNGSGQTGDGFTVNNVNLNDAGKTLTPAASGTVSFDELRNTRDGIRDYTTNGGVIARGSDGGVVPPPTDQPYTDRAAGSAAHPDDIEALRQGLKEEEERARANTTPGRFNGYMDIEKHILNQVHPEETEAEKRKRERREKQEAWLARVADMLGSWHKSYSYARGVKPMELPNASAKVRERIDRLRKEREANRDKNLGLATQLARLRMTEQQYKDQLALKEREYELKKELNDAHKGYYDTQSDATTKRADAYVRHLDITEDQNQQKIDNQSNYQNGRLEESRRSHMASEGIQQQKANTAQTRAANGGSRGGGGRGGGGRGGGGRGGGSLSNNPNYKKVTVRDNGRTETYYEPKTNSGGRGGRGGGFSIHGSGSGSGKKKKGFKI